MKNELLLNQINFLLKEKQRQIEYLAIAKQKGDISSNDYAHAIKSRQGAINALQLDIDSDLEAKIVDNINMYQQARKKLEVNVLNNEDKNIDMFYLLCGAIDVLMLLLTCTSNPLSACPLNKDILFSKSILELEEEYNFVVKSDKKKAEELKQTLKITKDLWEKNQTILRNL